MKAILSKEKKEEILEISKSFCQLNPECSCQKTGALSCCLGNTKAERIGYEDLTSTSVCDGAARIEVALIFITIRKAKAELKTLWWHWKATAQSGNWGTIILKTREIHNAHLPNFVPEATFWVVALYWHRIQTESVLTVWEDNRLEIMVARRLSN